MKFFLILLSSIFFYSNNEIPLKVEIRSISSKVDYRVAQTYEAFYFSNPSVNHRIDILLNKDSIKTYANLIAKCLSKEPLKNIDHVDLRKVFLLKYNERIDTVGYDPFYKYIHFKKNYYRCNTMNKYLKIMEP